jgi:hypothetical protein
MFCYNIAKPDLILFGDEMRFELSEMDFGMIIDRGLKLFKDNFIPLVLIVAIFYGPFTFAMNYKMSITVDSLKDSPIVTNIIDKLMKGQIPTEQDLNIEELLTDKRLVSTWGMYNIIGNILFLLEPLAYLSVYHILFAYLLGSQIPLGKAIRFAASKYWILLLAFILTALLFSALSCLACTFSFVITLCNPILVIMLEMLLFVFVLVFSSVFMAFIPCVVASENVNSRKSISRTWKLLRGFWWRSLSILILMAIITGVIVLIFSSMGRAFSSFFPQNLKIPFNSSVYTLFSVLAQPLMMCVIFMMYVDIRIRKEGYDLNLLAERTLGPMQSPPDAESKDKSQKDTDKDDVWN